MRLGGRTTWIVLVLLLPLMGLVMYRIGVDRWAAYHFQAAGEALEQRDFRTARSHLKKTLAVWSDDLAVRLLAAQAARRQGDVQEAMQQLRFYEEQNGSPDKLALEKQLLGLQGGNLEEADQLLGFCRNNPEDPETPLLLEAIIEGSLHTFKLFPDAPGKARAQQALDLWFEQRPGPVDQCQGLVWRALLRGVANESAQALADLRKALELNPDHFGARMHLALGLFEQAPEEAAAHLQRLHNHYTEDRQVSKALATIRRQLGQFKEARELLDQLLTSQPDDVTSLVQRGYLAMNTGDPEAGERWLRQAVELAPHVPDITLALSGCLTLAGKHAEAKMYHEKGMKLDEEEKKKWEEQAKMIYAGGKK
jgi:tetratricopeptide (TPR) repeat protein